MRSLASVLLGALLSLSVLSSAGSLAAQTTSAEVEPLGPSAASDLEAAAKKAARSLWGPRSIGTEIQERRHPRTGTGNGRGDR